MYEEMFATSFPAVVGYDKGEADEQGRTHLLAPDLETAKQHAAARGLGETVQGPSMWVSPIVLPSEWLALGDIPQAMHAACWLGFVAMKAGTTTPEELLSDGGILHDLAHLMLPEELLRGQPRALGLVKAHLPTALKALEARTPGYTRTKPVEASALATHYPRPRI